MPEHGVRQRGRIYERLRGNILILSTHPILDQLAKELLDGLDAGFSPSRRVIVYCGIHKSFGWHVLRRGLKIGIQTEQFFDEEGAALWGAEGTALKRARFSLNFLDFLLDINDTNKLAYTGLTNSRAAKVCVGPHIFPRKAPPLVAHTQNRMVFYGAWNSARRRQIISPMVERGLCDVIEDGVFGDRLSSRVGPYKAVLNVHYAPGVYTEYPRLLSAMMQGKPVVSERLSSLMKKNEHYAALDDFNAVDLGLIYKKFSSYLCDAYSFQGFLENIIVRRG